MYQNVGAKADSDNTDNFDIPTKKALKALIAATPAKVILYSTDAMGPNYRRTWSADKLDIGVKYSVTGPNPYKSRKWYATIERTATGVTVK
jgi:hypothetical protein